MKKYLYLILILFNYNLFSQKIDIKKYGAKGNGINDDTEYFIKAIEELKNNYSKNKKPSILYIPNGIYNISKTLILDKFISIEGEFSNITSLKLKNENIPLILLEENKSEEIIYNSYNSIKNLRLLGPNYNLPFINKDNVDKTNRNQNSVGVLVKGLRTRIENLQIEGFYNAGIEVNGSYYTFISNCFLLKNNIGLLVTNTSTSVYFNKNELRFNSVAIIINKNSYANFINNNLIESNTANFRNYDYTKDHKNIQSNGRGIVLENTSANLINNNYLENHYVNFTISNSNKNIISDNFYAIINNVLNPGDFQISLQLLGKSNENSFKNNVFMKSEQNLNSNKILIENNDYSSNYLDFGIDNNNVINQINSVILNQKNRPLIR